MSAVRVRVRGIHSTALTKILVDSGFEVTHTSKVIRDRLNVEDSREPPTVTVKDTDQKHAILVVGEYEHAKRVYDTLKDYAVAKWVSKLPLHGIVKGRVVELRGSKAIVDLGGFRGVVEGKFDVGEELPFDVSRPFMPNDEFARLSTNYTVFGRFVALIKGLDRRVIFSRHITSKRLKEDLIALTNLSNVGDWCVKWRSSAVLGSVEEMLRDLRETLKRALEIMEKCEKAEVGETVYEGEFFAILWPKRDEFDEVRNSVVPTVRGHHSLKSVDEAEVVEFSEFLLASGFDRDGVSEGVRNYILKKMREERLIEIEHVSALSGRVLRLTPGRLIEEFKLKRVFRGHGVFDGLNVKKEPGDYDLMEFMPGVPLILHKYHSRDGELKGVYVNVNTPPEIGRRRIRYLDLEVDVVAGEEVRVVDLDKLERACDLGILNEDLKQRYVKIAETVENYLKSHELKEVTLRDLAESLID